MAALVARIAAGALLLTVTLAGAGAAGADPEPDPERSENQTIPSRVLLDVSGVDIGTALASGERVTDIEVVGPDRYDATLVANGVGSHPFLRSPNSVMLLATAADVGQYLDENVRRIIDLERSGSSFVVDTVPNTGRSAKAWWWYLARTPQQITDLLAQHSARPVDIDPIGGGRYDIVMIANTGVDQADSTILYGQQASDLRALARVGQRPIDVEYDDTGYTAIAVPNPRHLRWELLDGVLGPQVVAAATDGARVYDVERRGLTYTALVLNPAESPLTGEDASLEALLDAWGTAPHGFYAADVDELIDAPKVYSSYQEDVPFNPASAIKFVIAVYALQQVQQGNVTMDTPIPWEMPGCPSSGGLVAPLKETITKMMVNSNNYATWGMMNYFGLPAINSWLAANGFDDTRVSNWLCGDAPPSRWTMEAAAKFYGAAFDGTLIEPFSIVDLMIHQNGHLPGFDNAQLAALAVSLHRVQSVDDFLFRSGWVAKGGSFAVCPTSGACSPPYYANQVHTSMVWVPHYLGPDVTSLQYVFVGYYDDAQLIDCSFQGQSEPASDYDARCPEYGAVREANNRLYSELYRPVYTDALLSYPPDDEDPPETSIDISGPTISGKVVIHLLSDEAGGSIRCRRDDLAWRLCSERVVYRGLSRGWHRVTAAAVDRAGNEDQSPARARFWIK